MACALKINMIARPVPSVGSLRATYITTSVYYRTPDSGSNT